MSVFRSVSKSVFSSVHRATNVPAALLGASAPLSAAFTPSTLTPVAGVNVTFTNGSTGAVSYSWDFGDGTVPSTSTSPTHYFVGNGPYTVTLAATDSQGNTETATATISPTTPSANANLTLVETIDFSADMNSSSTGGWDSINKPVVTGTIRSMPVGAKLATDTTIGTQGYVESGFSFYYSYDRATNQQLGGWFYIDALPSVPVYLVIGEYGVSGRGGVTLEANGTLTYFIPGGSTIVYNTPPIKTWFWVGIAIGPSATPGGIWASVKLFYKALHDTAASVIYSGDYYIAGGSSWTAIGRYYPSGSSGGGRSRVSRFTRHTMANLSSSGYPTDIVPPQSEDMIWLVNPATGSDSNDGVTQPIQTVGRLNYLLDEVFGIQESHTDGVAGSGPHVVIDTSASRFDIGVTGLQIKKNGVWLKPKAGNTYIDFAADVIISAGSWTVTGGYTGIYQIACDQVHARLWSNDVYHEKVASLALLDAAAAGAMCVVGGVLYAKPFGSTDPRSDGKVYRYSRYRPENGGDVVGMPAVNVKARNVRLTGCDINYTAANGNGSYAIGDTAGFGGALIVEDCRTRFGDKHLICYTINATESTIITRNCIVEQSISQALTSFMAAGSGNVHLYENITIEKAELLARSADGAVGPCWYSHGGFLTFSEVEHRNCDYGANNLSDEPIQGIQKWIGITANLMTHGAPIEMRDCILSAVPRVGALGGIVSGVTMVGAGVGGSPVALGRTLLMENNSYDMRGANTNPDNIGVPAMYVPTASPNAPTLSFTGNTIRFGNSGNSVSMPLLKDFTSAMIGTFDYNTYYYPAGAAFVKAFNDGITTADRTFAQWQALGYDLNSTRLDP